MNKRIIILAVSLVTLLLVIIAIHRDIIYKNDYTGDLRNRVVGARLIDDGKIPYFYQWKPSDGLRYYDPSSFSSSIVSNRSANPIFHELLIPICNFSQYQITNIWFYLEYFSYAIIVFVSISLARNYKLKLLVWIASLALLFTDAWKSHVSAGQLYILLPFLTSLFVLLLSRARNFYYYLACGFLAALLILIRPNFIIFFLPFILVLKQFKLRDTFALLLPIIIFIIWIFASPFQQALWKEYVSFLQRSIYMHQHESEHVMDINPNQTVKYDVWEGIIWKNMNKIRPSDAIAPHSENGNFFVLYNKIFRTKINTLALSLICYALIITLFFYFYILTKGHLSLPVLKHALKTFFWKDDSLSQQDTSTSLIEQFMYPMYGPGQMWEAVSNKIIEKGGRLLLNSEVIGINYHNDKSIIFLTIKDLVSKNISTIEGDVFFSSMPVRDLISKSYGIKLPGNVVAIAEGLQYRDFLIVGLLLDNILFKENNSSKTILDNWIYLQDKGIKAGRVQIFNNWSPFMINDPNKVWIGVEYFSSEQELFWQQTDEKIIAQAIMEMTQIGLINGSDVEDAVVLKVLKAYPSYYGTYNRFDEIKSYLNAIPNLYCIGRNGMHKYNNSDHSMLTAMEAVKHLKSNAGNKNNIWSVNTEEVYHEEI